MNFGRELQDFVDGFRTGYSMFKSKDEREWEKEQRQMMRERHQWGREDRDFREREFGFRMDESGRAHGRWELSHAERQRALDLQEAQLKLAIAKEQGAIPEIDLDGYSDPYAIIQDGPDDVPHGPDDVPLVQPMNYAPQSDGSALSRGGPQAEMVSARPQRRANARDIEDGEIRAYLDALASVESAGSGDYSAIGPTHRKLGRALGRYQVMEENVGPWSRQALGRTVTADEFLRNPEIQDAVAAYKFREYVDRFGDPALAAQAWFAGPGGVGTNRSDVLGTTVPEYARRFNSALSRTMARGGQVAALPEDEDRVTPQGNPPLQYAQADRQAQLEALPVGGQMQMGPAFGLTGAPQGQGRPGEVRRGTDGQTYMWAETRGMAGATGPWGWIPYNDTGGQTQMGQDILAANGRPMLRNPDGSVSTEESITITDPRINGGRPTNIPSIWNGRRTSSEDEAVRAALQSGQSFPAFNSIEEAVSAAKARSNSLGDAVRAQMGQLEALPVDGSLPPPSYEGGMEGQQEPPTNDRWEAARRSVRDGLNYAAKQSGFDINSAIDDPELEKLRQNYIRGYGAAPAQMMKQVQDKIDPERKMRPAERNMAAMAEVWKFYMDQGEFDKAQKAAAAMVQFHRRAFQQFSALARAALQGGDIDNATKAAVAAYANIPNGRDLEVKKLDNGLYEVKVTDIKSGDTITERVMNPTDFAAIAMNFNPAMFEDELLAAAGAERPELDRMSPTERENAVALIKDFSEEYFGEDSPYNPQEQTGIRDIAADLIEHKGNGLDAERALRVAEGLLHPERNLADGGRLMEGGRASFDYKRIPNSDLYELDVNGRKYIVSSGTVIAIEKIRLKKLQEEQERQDLDDRRSERDERALDFIGRGMRAFDEYARLGVFGPTGMLGSALSDTIKDLQDKRDKRRIPEIGARTTPKQGRLVPQGVLPE